MTAQSKGINDAIALSKVSGIGQQELTKLRDYDGQWKTQMSSTQATTFSNVPLSGTQHENVMEGANKASKSMLMSAGLSSGVATAIETEKSKGQFKNVTDLTDRVASLGTSGLTSLKNFSGTFGAFFPKSGAASDASTFSLEGQVMTIGQAKQITSNVSNASTAGVGID